MRIPGRYVAMFLMASGYAGKLFQSTIIHPHVILISGFAMDLVWVSNSIPRPPAYGSYCFAVDFAEPCRI